MESLCRKSLGFNSGDGLTLLMGLEEMFGGMERALDGDGFLGNDFMGYDCVRLVYSYWGSFGWSVGWLLSGITSDPFRTRPLVQEGPYPSLPWF